MEVLDVGNSELGLGVQAPRSLYLHVPFCRHHCGYCNFTVLAGRPDLVEPFLEAIERELSWLEGPHELDTLFIGGGTPTQLQDSQLERLLTLVRQHFRIATGHEWTVEANPSDVTAAKIQMLVQAGVTRISLGAQSFDRRKLSLLERDHDAATIARAVNLAQQAGCRVSLDLIFAAPQEERSVWQQDLERALELEPQHVSTYGLTYERGTRFYGHLVRGQLQQLDEELEREFYELAIERLTLAGMEHYEVSNFARPAERCRHNEVYWSGGQYFGVGPGAAGFIAGCRYTNHRSTTAYLRRVLAGQSPVAETERLGPEDRARERLVFALRRLEGVERESFQRETGFALDQLAGATLKKFCGLGLLEDTGVAVRLTRQGLMVSDAIWPELL